MKVAISLAKVTVPLKSDEVDFVSALVPKPQPDAGRVGLPSDVSLSLDHETRFDRCRVPWIMRLTSAAPLNGCPPPAIE